MVKGRTLQISSLAVGKGSVAAQGIAINREEELAWVEGRKNSRFFFRELAAPEQSNAMQQQVLVHKQNTACDWGRRVVVSSGTRNRNGDVLLPN